ESQAARAREQHTQRGIDMDEAQRQAIEARALSYRQYTRSLEDANMQLERQYAAQVAGVGMGDRQREQINAVNSVYEQQSKTIQDIRRQMEDRTLSAPEGEKRIADAI